MHEHLERELKQVIVSALMLDDVTPDEIESDAALFGDGSGGGLGLDSIDALELAMAIERRFGVKIQPSDEEGPKIFGSVRTLAAHVAAHVPAASTVGQAAGQAEEG
ncbi:phosphopantetheine-binding protein [Paraliomyxa miuraensis]|uniref:phosphopantetheine-binding protein n=1 Tax=Paraliomyxa miuraensis TaxID=376150 RepID=UPI0022560CEE|nr:phosphopantetheine-binding protein [Paraliomyxa miuraensis]